MITKEQLEEANGTVTFLSKHRTHLNLQEVFDMLWAAVIVKTAQIEALERRIKNLEDIVNA